MAADRDHARGSDATASRLSMSFVLADLLSAVTIAGGAEQSVTGRVSLTKAKCPQWVEGRLRILQSHRLRARGLDKNNSNLGPGTALPSRCRQLGSATRVGSCDDMQPPPFNQTGNCPALYDHRKEHDNIGRGQLDGS